MGNVSQLTRILNQYVDEGEVAGASLLVTLGGREYYSGCAGKADLEHGIAMRKNTLFRLYSLTKPIVATAMMMLVERGEVDLWDEVARYLPGFKHQRVCRPDGQTEPANRPVTVYDLLSMTSGLVYDGDTPAGQQTAALFDEVKQGWQSDPRGTMSTVEFANRVGEIPLAFQPGSSWHYGVSADVIGAIVEVASGQTLGSFLEHELFEPLGMNDTGFYVKPSDLDRLAVPYAFTPGQPLTQYRDVGLGLVNVPSLPPRFESGGAGLISSIEDYVRFGNMLLRKGRCEGGRVLMDRTVDYMCAPQVPSLCERALEPWDASLIGYGYNCCMRIMTHPSRSTAFGSRGSFGWDGWMGCYFEADPTIDLCFVLMLQRAESGCFSLTRKLKNVLYAQLGQ